jgi:hypothetical protein
LRTQGRDAIELEARSGIGMMQPILWGHDSFLAVLVLLANGTALVVIIRVVHEANILHPFFLQCKYIIFSLSKMYEVEMMSGEIGFRQYPMG